MAWLGEQQLAKFKKVGRRVRISDQALIYGAENIEVGDNVRIDAQTIILAGTGSLRIGSHVHIAVQCLLAAGGGISLGDFTDMSMGAKLISASDDASGENLVGPVHPPHLIKVLKAPIVMDHYSWVGTNGVLMPGVHMEQGAVLGTGGVALGGSRLDAWGIYVGVPGKMIKRRSQEMILKSQEAIQIFEREWMEED